MIRLAALALLMSGCSLAGLRPAEPVPATPATQLADARVRWAARGPDAYTMTQRRICFCPPEFVGPFAVTVRGGAVVSVLLGGEAAPVERAVSVEALFDLVADAYAREADDVRVSYDPALGHPTEIRIDYRRQIADEEVMYTVEDLKPAP